MMNTIEVQFIPLYELLPSGAIVRLNSDGGEYISRWVGLVYPFGVPNKLLKLMARN